MLCLVLFRRDSVIRFVSRVYEQLKSLGFEFGLPMHWSLTTQRHCMKQMWMKKDTEKSPTCMSAWSLHVTSQNYPAVCLYIPVCSRPSIVLQPFTRTGIWHPLCLVQHARIPYAVLMQLCHAPHFTSAARPTALTVIGCERVVIIRLLPKGPRLLHPCRLRLVVTYFRNSFLQICTSHIP